MTDALLTSADRKEGLSLAYAKALAARAGYATSAPQPDRASVDLCVEAGGLRSPKLDLQLKATTKLDPPRGGLRSFQLRIKNYNDLRKPTQTPRLLVVLELPKEESRWMTVTEECLTLRRCAYWHSLQKGHDEIEGQSTVTIRIPDRNVFDVDALRPLMEKSRRGETW